MSSSKFDLTEKLARQNEAKFQSNLSLTPKQQHAWSREFYQMFNGVKTRAGHASMNSVMSSVKNSIKGIKL
jgi:hypothetical protein